MMKKLLILMLVLGVASAANAALLISVNGEIDPCDTTIYVVPSETVTIDIWGDGQTPQPQGLYLFTIKPTCDCILSGGELIYEGSLSELYPAEYPGEYEYIQSEMGLEELPCSAIFINLADGGSPGLPLDGTLVDNVILHCNSPVDDCVVYLVSAEDFSIFDTQIIHQIPEPMTITLLGLGGLLLRRRK